MDSPYWKGPLPGVDVQRRYLWKTFRGKPNSIPGSARKCSASARNPVRLPPGILFDLPRNAVRLAPEYASYLGIQHDEVVGDNGIEFIILPICSDLRFVGHIPLRVSSLGCQMRRADDQILRLIVEERQDPGIVSPRFGNRRRRICWTCGVGDGTIRPAYATRRHSGRMAAPHGQSIDP